MFVPGITGVFGPSGSGKTSLLKSIAGMEHPEEGHISINGRLVYCKERKINEEIEDRRIGYVFQEGRLFPHLTVEKNLRYGLKKTAKGLSYEEVVDMLQLEHVLKSKPSKISGGERQRTALGRSLLSSPELLLLDEPFSALDNHLRNQILPFLYKIHQSVKIPIVVVSHDITDLLKLSDRLFIINNGRCLGHGEYTSLLKVPEVRQLLGSNVFVNTLDMRVEDVDLERGMAKLHNVNLPDRINAVYSDKRFHLINNNRVKLFVRADDIALADRYVQGISVQNQLEGVVVEIINGSNVNLCVVNVGVQIVVEISAESIHRMCLKPNSTVWCLFKSVSIDFAV